MGIQFPPIAFLYLLYFYIYIFLFCTLVKRIIKLKRKLKRQRDQETTGSGDENAPSFDRSCVKKLIADRFASRRPRQTW